MKDALTKTIDSNSFTSGAYNGLGLLAKQTASDFSFLKSQLPYLTKCMFQHHPTDKFLFKLAKLGDKTAVQKRLVKLLEQGASYYSQWFDKHGNNGSGISSPWDCSVLYAMVRWTRPVIAIETGTGSGCASTIILRAMEDNSVDGFNGGTLFSIDLPVTDKIQDSSDGVRYQREGSQVGWTIPEELRHRLRQYEESVQTALPNILAKLDDIRLMVDFAYLDSSHTPEVQLFEAQSIFPYLRKDKVMIMDDITTGWKQFCESNSYDPYFNSGMLGAVRK